MTAPLTPEDRAAIRERAEKATVDPGGSLRPLATFLATGVVDVLALCDALDAAEATIANLSKLGLTLQRGSSVFMDGTGDYHLRRRDQPGILRTVILSFAEADALASALGDQP